MTQFDPELLDEVIHSSRLRAMIMAALITVDSAEFTFLREMTKSTDGNLGVHLKRLEEAGYVVSSKRMIRKWKVTDYALTPKGRQAFVAYVEQLERLAGKTEKGGGQ